MLYFQFLPDQRLPEPLEQTPCRTMVLADLDTSAEFQYAVCQWLMKSGCLYMMAWGRQCEDWSETIKNVNRSAFQSAEIPDNKLIISTGHPKDSLEDLFWFCRHTAMHPLHQLQQVLLVHITEQQREEQLRGLFASA